MTDLKILSILKKCIIPVVFATGISACENNLEEVDELTKEENYPLSSADEVEVLYSEVGEVKVKVIAKKLDRYQGEEPYMEMPEGVELLFFDSAMNVSSRLTANYAIHRIKENKMEAKDDVVVVNKKGEQLNTEHLIWDETERKIYSNEFVKITTPDEILMGEGFESNEDFTKYKIKNISATIDISEEDEGNEDN